jgi:hypothetical protein
MLKQVLKDKFPLTAHLSFSTESDKVLRALKSKVSWSEDLVSNADLLVTKHEAECPKNKTRIKA